MRNPFKVDFVQVDADWDLTLTELKKRITYHMSHLYGSAVISHNRNWFQAKQNENQQRTQYHVTSFFKTSCFFASVRKA